MRCAKLFTLMASGLWTACVFAPPSATLLDDPKTDVGLVDQGLIPKDAQTTDLGVDMSGSDGGMADTGETPRDAGVDLGEDMGTPDLAELDLGPEDLGPDLGPPDPDLGVLDLGSPDTGEMDAGPVDTGDPFAGFPYTPSNFVPLDVVGAAVADLNIGAGECVINTTTGASNGAGCNSVPPLVMMNQSSANLPVAILPVTGALVTGTLRVIGERPLLIAVFGNGQFAGTIYAGGQPGFPGPGSGLDCTNGQGSIGGARFDEGGGGGGGGFGSAAGDGGDSAGTDPSNTAFGAPGGDEVGAENMIPLLGGCVGGRGGNSGGAAGEGGGAIQISASGNLAFVQSARLIVTGGGGGGGPPFTGGGGGGSGGGLLLEADQLNILNSRFLAGGGGGGEGGSTYANSPFAGDGADGSPNAGDRAPGGRGFQSGGNGGEGGALFGPPSDGSPGAFLRDAFKGGGGGGGGSVGRIRLNVSAGCTIAGQSLFSPEPSTNNLCVF